MTDSQDLADLYRIRFEREFLPRKRAIWKVLCRDFFQQFIPEDATVVDVACGYGEFINNVRAAKKIAVDLNPETKSHLDSSVEFHALAAANIETLGERQVDVLFTSNFLEHLPDKRALETFLEQVLTVLKPGGRYLIMGPNLRYLPGKYWDFYDHHLGLTHLSLTEALELKGFKVERVVDRFLPYTTQGALPTHPVLVRMYLKVPLVWQLLGKQFFIVATKRT